MTVDVTGAAPGRSAAIARGRASGQRAYLWERYGRITLGVVGILLFLGFCEGYTRLGPNDLEYLPAPTSAFEQLFLSFQYTAYWEAIGQTLRAWFLGGALGTVAAVVIGVVIGSSTFLRRATHSTIEFLRPIPSVGLIPIAALVFGPTLRSELLIIGYACFWLVLIQVLYGIVDIDKVADDTVRTFRMSWWQRTRVLVLPTVLPYLMTGVRLVATVALILAISVELVLGTPGIGQQVMIAQLNGAPEALMAFIITSGMLGLAINALTQRLTHRVLFWHASVRSEVAS